MPYPNTVTDGTPPWEKSTINDAIDWRITVEWISEGVTLEQGYDLEMGCPHGDETPWSVYVYTTEEGAPLYIGQTRNVAGRFYSHLRYQAWAHRAVAHYWFTDICCSRCAGMIERAAIKLYRPEFNKIREYQR